MRWTRLKCKCVPQSGAEKLIVIDLKLFFIAHYKTSSRKFKTHHAKNFLEHFLEYAVWIKNGCSPRWNSSMLPMIRTFKLKLHHEWQAKLHEIIIFLINDPKSSKILIYVLWSMLGLVLDIICGNCWLVTFWSQLGGLWNLCLLVTKC